MQAEKEKFALVSDHNRSLLRWQPGARMQAIVWQHARGMRSYLGVQASIGLEWLKQVMQALIVDLNIAHADPAVLSVILASKLQSLGKQVSQGTWYETGIVNISICMATLSFTLDSCQVAAASQNQVEYILGRTLCTSLYSQIERDLVSGGILMTCQSN